MSDAIDAGAPIEELFVVAELATEAMVDNARRAGATIHVVGAQIVKAISDSVTPQGMVAVVGSPIVGLDALTRESGLVLILARVSDPGNVGTLIRTAAAAGADAVIVAEGSADPLNPKTARASAASLFATTLVSDVSLGSAVTHVRSLGYTVLGAESDAPSTIYSTDLSRPLALVLGNESWGLPDDQKSLVIELVSIPMPGTVESLNVATAGSIIMFEALRQRRADAGPTVSSASKEGTGE